MNTADKRKIEVAREEVRAALNGYEIVLSDAANNTDVVSEMLNITISQTEVKSAKRVLWMEN